MYLNDFNDKDDDNDSDADHEDDTEEGAGTKKNENKLSKGTKPREIMSDRSLYCVILVYFLQELHPFVLQLGLNPANSCRTGYCRLPA
jgi:hypothetical protein